MRKLISILLCVGCLLGLCGCGPKENTTPTETIPTEPTVSAAQKVLDGKKSSSSATPTPM